MGGPRGGRVLRGGGANGCLPRKSVKRNRVKRTKMRRSPSWREAAPRASPPEKRLLQSRRPRRRFLNGGARCRPSRACWRGCEWLNFLRRRHRHLALRIPRHLRRHRAETRRHRRHLSDAEHRLRVLQVAPKSRLRERVRATEHAPRNTFSVLERRHGLAEIVERGAVLESASAYIHLILSVVSVLSPENASRHGHRFAQQRLAFFETL